MNKIFKIALSSVFTRESGLELDGLMAVISSLDEDIRENAVLMIMGEYVEPTFNSESKIGRGALFVSYDPLAARHSQVKYEYQSEITTYGYFDRDDMDYREAKKAVKAGTFVSRTREEIGSRAESVEIPTGKYKISTSSCSASAWQG